MVYYISQILGINKSYLDTNSLFKNNLGELYIFKVDSDLEDGVVIRDNLKRILPIDWYDIPEFSRVFNLLNEQSKTIKYNFKY